jgi:hypothetical protein
MQQQQRLAVRFTAWLLLHSKAASRSMREVKRLRHWSLFCMTNIVFHAGFGYNDAF